MTTRIGNTPLIKLNRLPDTKCADVYVKYEGANPTGSMKDRMALAMIEGAERSGLLKPDNTIIEYTGGSTGSALAMVCAAKGYKAHFVSSDAFSEEKIRTMRAFGAKVELIASPDGNITADLINRMKLRVQELNEDSTTFWIDQFNNVDNCKGYHAMAEEILSQLKGEVDEFIMGVGTGGCFSGNVERLKKDLPNLRCVATEPFYVRALSGGDLKGSHRLEGMGIGFIASICRTDLIDEVIAIKDEDAYQTARELARREGIFGGITSGANVWAALQRAKTLGPGKKIVTVICDSGLKYLSGDLY